ncbi:DUF5050 domain-containing protein [Candidatus Poribacteria bacterium]|nr:DUF5050 domain-containing protein [Candidatus Poribacteria bacterium]MYG08510.1 DUF5050 domain-containing protein [Candidatus Poribacteria bacterium]MYK23061.1 DUF5050 domain-containing protein [Candidatus Poribacteria bacterium]
MKTKYAHLAFGIALVLSSSLFVMNLSAQVLGKQYISFSSLRSGNLEIYIIDTEGNNLRNLTNHPASDHSATWSPSGRAFAYVSHREDDKGEIYVMDLSKNKTRRLTNHPASERHLAWSPDGKWIAFSSNRKGDEPGNYDIYKMDANGENLQRLTNEGRYNSGPAWSPDSCSIAFYSIRNDDGGIYVMDTDGKKVKKLATGIAPSWSPDGERITYYNLVWNGRSGIFVMDAKGKNSRRVSPPETWSERPAWSPDGEWIACMSELENPWGNPNRDSNIYLIKPDTLGKPRQITQHEAMDYSPAWVPSGFLAVSPTANTQTTLWGKLKQNPHTMK